MKILSSIYYSGFFSIFLKSSRIVASFLIAISITLTPTTLLAVKTKLSSAQDARISKLGHHPTVDGPLSSFYSKTITTYELNGARNVKPVGNAIDVVFESRWGNSTGLAVVKKDAGENRTRKEPYLYALSRLAGLNCIVPTFTYKKVALEVLVKFLPSNITVPYSVQTFYDNYKDSRGVITLLSLKQQLRNKGYSTKSRTKATLDRYIDKQSLQELCLARYIFSLGDMHDRNIVLRYGPNGIGFYTFDTAGLKRNNVWGAGGHTVLSADSMGVTPNGNGIIDLCFSDALTPKSKKIIANWSKLRRTKGLRARLNTLWPIPKKVYQGYVADNTERVGHLVGADTAYDRWMNRIALLQIFVGRNTGVKVKDLDLAFLGVLHKPTSYRDVDFTTSLHTIESGINACSLMSLSQILNSYKPRALQSYEDQVSTLKNILQTVYYRVADFKRTTVITKLIEYIGSDIRRRPYAADYYKKSRLLRKLKTFFPKEWLSSGKVVNWFIPPLFLMHGGAVEECLPAGFSPQAYMAQNNTGTLRLKDMYGALPPAVRAVALESQFLIEGCRMGFKATGALPKLPRNVTLAHFWAQNPGIRVWALSPPDGKPRFEDGNIYSETKYALKLLKINPKIKCDPRKLPNNFNLKLFWRQNPNIREWALGTGKFTEGNIKAERKYARSYFKWNPEAQWDPRELPDNISLKLFWMENPGIREWALNPPDGKPRFKDGDKAGELEYAKTFYKWNLNAVWDPRELPASFRLDQFWAANPGIRKWALKKRRFRNGNTKAEMEYARIYYKWTLTANPGEAAA